MESDKDVWDAVTAAPIRIFHNFSCKLCSHTRICFPLDDILRPLESHFSEATCTAIVPLYLNSVAISHTNHNGNNTNNIDLIFNNCQYLHIVYICLYM